MHDQNRTADGEYGLRWAGPIRHVSAATQQSAVDLPLAIQPLDETPGDLVDNLEASDALRRMPDGGP